MQATATPTVEAIQALYDQGKTAEALEAIRAEGQGQMTRRQDWVALQAIKAWCHYRRKEYPECRGAIMMAGGDVKGGNVKAIECFAQLTAYVDKDDALLMQIASWLPNNVGIANAFVIRARDKDSILTHRQVMEFVGRFLGSTEISAINLVNNAGRFFHAKIRQKKGRTLRNSDLFTALGLQESAFIRYGQGNKNLHHRAALLFWQSKVVEELFGKEAAQTPARGSFYLWERQVALDPTNPAFRTGLENSKKRLAELGVDWSLLP